MMSDKPRNIIKPKNGGKAIRYLEEVGKNANNYPIWTGIDYKTKAPLLMHVIPKDGILPDEKQTYDKVVQFLKTRNHPNINKLYCSFQTQRNYYLAFERGSFTLREYMKTKGALPESEAKLIIKQIFQACVEMHKNKFIINSILPDNILLFETPQGMVAKLSEFSFIEKSNTDVDKVNLLKFTYGPTSLYSAPEVIKEKNYCYGSDIWSIGFTLFELFSGKMPFVCEDVVQLENAIDAGEYQIDTNVNPVSADAIEMIQLCLQADANKRANVMQLQQLPFLADSQIKNVITGKKIMLNVNSIVKHF